MGKARQDYRVYLMDDGRVLCARCKVKEYPRRFPGRWFHFRVAPCEHTSQGGVVCTGCGHEVYAPEHGGGRPPSEEVERRNVMLRMTESLFARFDYQRLLEGDDPASYAAFARRLLLRSLGDLEAEQPFDVHAYARLLTKEAQRDA